MFSDEPIAPSAAALPDWDFGGAVTLGFGYRDNLAYAHFHPHGSPYFSSALELLSWHRPKTGPEFQWILSAEDLRFFAPLPAGTAKSDYEQTVSSTAEWKLPLTPRWQASLKLDFSYQDQLVDISTPDLITPNSIQTNVIRVQGENFQIQPALRFDWTDSLWSEVSGFAAVRPYSAPLDDYLEYGPRLTCGWTPAEPTSFTLTTAHTWRDYATRQTLTHQGDPTLPLHLTYQQTRVECGWVQYWTANRHWRTAVVASFKRSTDNGSGVFDFDRGQISGQLRYAPAKWTFSSTVRWSRYWFEQFPDAAKDFRQRNREELTLSFRTEYQWHRHWKVFSDWNHELVHAGQAVEEYSVNQVSTGVVWEF